LEHVGSVDQQQFETWLGKMVWSAAEAEEAERNAQQQSTTTTTTTTTQHDSLPSLSNPSFYRYKGIFSVLGDENKFVLQGVHKLFELNETQVPWRESERRCKLLIVGRNLNRHSIQTEFQQLLQNSQ
jgi:G3E family GTPase